MQIDYSVAQALMQHSVGTIATAIEQHSCYHGRDRFGRLKLLQEEEKEKIFKLLEDYHIQEKIWYLQNESYLEDGEAPSDIFDGNFELPHWQFGWPKNSIPDILILENKIKKGIDGEFDLEAGIAEFEARFNEKLNSIPFETRDEIYSKARYSHLAIIGALIKECGLKFDEPKIANKIAYIISQQTGWSINERTVRNLLKEIPSAIERKAK